MTLSGQHWDVPHKLSGPSQKTLSWSLVTMVICLSSACCLHPPSPSDPRSQTAMYTPQVWQDPGPFHGVTHFQFPWLPQPLPMAPTLRTQICLLRGCLASLPCLVAMLLGPQEQLPQLRLGQAQSQNTFAQYGISPYHLKPARQTPTCSGLPWQLFPQSLTSMP